MSSVNVALIFAGGMGQRMNSRTLPKQFLELHGKPIIIYTLEHFEAHPEIDGIVVVCLDGWQEYLRNLLDRFHIQKVKAIVTGGLTGQQSICNGVKKLHALYSDDTIVLIHDGVRPLIDLDVITNNIHTVQKYGSAITVAPVTETVSLKGGNNQIQNIVPRSQCQLARAPQSFYLGPLYKAHLQAMQEGMGDFIDSASLMLHYGTELYAVDGPTENIKITTPTDFYIFRALVDAREDSQIFGL